MLARRWFPAAAIALAGLTRILTLSMPLVEAHAFRQTQTAFPAVIWRNSPIDLLHPEVPVLGPPWALPFEFPLVQAIGAILMRMGLTPEVAMRGLALASFLASAGVLWLILNRHVTRRAADIALMVFLFSPLAIEWSRASLIEYPATLCALLFVLAVLEGAGRSRPGWLLVALISGGLVSLIKVTTAVFWLAPAVLTRRWLVVGAVAFAGAVGLAWTRFAADVRAENTYAGFLTLSQTADWIVGGDRLSPTTWVAAIGPSLSLAGMLLLPAGIAVIYRSERLVWAWMAIALLGSIALFPNLYAVHQYYTAAVSPAVAALVGGGIDEWLRRHPGVAPLFVGIAIQSLVLAWPSWSIAYFGGDPDHILAPAAEIRALTGPEDLVVMRHYDWSPAFFFYAERRGLVLSHGEPIPSGYVDVGQY